jgi:class 3 adenylate cyclase
VKNPIPYKVKEGNRKFYRITQIVYFIGLAGHIGGTFLFSRTGISEMIYFNLFYSVPAFLFALVVNRLGHHSLAFGVAFIELYFHQVAGTWYTGWGYGFQFWLIYLAALSFFNPQWKGWINYFSLFLVIAGLIVLYLYAQEGVYQLDPELMRTGYLMNLLSLAGLVPLLINYYAKSTFRAERKLITEKEITEQQNIQLNEQHEQLVIEQDKTYKMLTKIESLFGQQVSQEVAQEMIKSESEIDSKIVDVTVMFLDIRDFTMFADSRKPAEVARFQNIVFGELIEIVKANKGIVSQILGDGIYAIFGAPVPNKHHAKNAVIAGFEMVKKVEELGINGKIPKIKVGIGVNSGKVMAGNVGNETRKFYSLTGTNVIIAARIEQLNKQFNSQFLISGNTFKIVEHISFDYKDLGKIPLKGIENEISVYQLA